MRIVISLAAVACLATAAPQQAPPATEVFLKALLPPGDVRTWINISNSPGYDNQPSFLPDSSAVLFSSNRDGKQTDIYRYDIARKRLSQVTNTPEQEYSPTMTPDGKTFSVVRVEADGAQRLWRFNLNGSNPRLVLENVKPVGYHAWIDATHVALFVLGSGGAPATLQIADTTTGVAEVIETGIGRSILVRPGRGTVSYISAGPARMIKEFDPKTRVSKPLVAPIEGSLDAAWTPDGRDLFMASGTMVFAASLVKEPYLGWGPKTNFATHFMDTTGPPRVGSITRMAVSPDGRWLAFVAEPRTP